MEIIDIIFLDDKIIIDLFVSRRYTRLSCARGLNNYILKKLPGLRKHQCYNDHHRSFVCEFRQTETAHALEHMLIEVILKLDPMPEEVSAWTNWNWEKNPEDTYRIELKYNNRLVFSRALLQSLQLLSESMNACLSSSHPFIIQLPSRIRQKLSPV